MAQVHERSHRAAVWLYGAVGVLWPLLTLATLLVNPAMLEALPHRPLALVSLALAIGGLVAVALGLRKDRDLQAFLGSCAFLTGMLAATAACLFPVMLRSVVDERWSLTAYNASVSPESLEVALRWWGVGLPLVVFYFYTLFRLHRGKAVAATHHDGY